MDQPLTYIDLFAGCGGLSLGLYNAGWRGLFAIEKSPDAFKTLKSNLIDHKGHFDWPRWLEKSNHDINDVLVKYRNHLIDLRGKVDLVVGGPPCQGFSTAGRRREDDVRNGLIRSYLKFIICVQPKLIFFENVKGFTLKFKKNKSKGKAYSQYVLNVLKRLGYEVEGKMIDFSQYGVPQKRTRFILVGVKKDAIHDAAVTAKHFFDIIKKNKNGFLSKKHLPLRPTLSQAISDLLRKNGVVPTPDRGRFCSGLYGTPKSNYQRFLRRGVKKNQIPDSHSFPNHSLEIEKRFKRLLKKKNDNKTLSQKLRKDLSISKHTIIPLSSNLPTPTITTLPDDYIHYSEPRIFTVREYARIQSFPDWFKFHGKYTTGGMARTKEVPRYTQIGNAIPPLFAEQTGLALQQLICGKKRKTTRPYP